MLRSSRTLRTLALTLSSSFVALTAFAQEPGQVQRWFESGRFQQVAEAASPDAPPQVRFLAGQSFLKQNAPDQAADAFRGLASMPESSPWHFIGRSAERLVGNQDDEALANAQMAVSMDGNLLEAHYQLGLVYAKRNDWNQAAAEFDRVSAIDPGYAYAHYYGGLAHYRAGRPDRMANHFEQFLRTAPEAPERPEVTQLMRTVRGR